MIMQLKDYLLNWYDLNKRSLPWRESRDPYRIWLSEIMLQQTRAETVLRYYERFLNHFPDVFALADADEDAVLKLWEGLGYYSRARNLHKASKNVAQMGGVFPNTVDELEKLPGVGPYAARAVASIAYDIPAPALDGNQMRVLSRILAEERILKTPFDLHDEAMALISRDRPGDYNQALMDLGSAVCTAKNPKCMICPLNQICRACQEGEAERYPLRPAPVAKREELRTICVIRSGSGIYIRRRTQKLLGGLYEFPSLDGHLSHAEAKTMLEAMGFSGLHGFEPLPDSKHVFTHLIWRMKGWLVTAEGVPEDGLIADGETFSSYAFPSALRPYHEIAFEQLTRKISL